MKKSLLFICFSLPSLASAASYTELGERSYASANYKQALKYFEKAVENNTSRGEAYFFTGSILESRREFEKSVAYFRKAIEKPLKREYKKAALWKLVLYFRRVKNYEEALKYTEMLNQMGVEHSTLEKVKAEAEVYLTPEKKEARKKLKKAQEIRKQWSKKKQKLKASNASQKKLARERNEVLEELADLYSSALRLDPELKNERWKLAHFQEQLERYNSALHTYQRIYDETKSTKAFYKIGLMQKALRSYKESVGTLSKVLEKNKGRNTLGYYARVNLAQSAYGLGDYDTAAKRALEAYKMHGDIGKQGNALSVHLLSCVAMLQPEEKANKLRRLKNFSARCSELVKADNLSNLDATARGIQELLWGKNSHFEYQDTEKKSALKQASKHYTNATLDKKQNIQLPHWANSDLPLVAEFFYELTDWQALRTLCVTHSGLLSQHSRYNLWYGMAAHGQGDYERATEFLSDAIEDLKGPPLSVAIAMAESYAEEKLIRSFKSFTENYLKKEKSEKERFIRQIEAAKSWKEISEERDDLRSWFAQLKYKYTTAEKKDSQGTSSEQKTTDTQTSGEQTKDTDLSSEERNNSTKAQQNSITEKQKKPAKQKEKKPEKKEQTEPQ